VAEVAAIKGYLAFYKEERPEHRKTDVYQVYNVGTPIGPIHLLGLVAWKSQWRRYSFFPANDKVFDATCLETITVFIRNLMDARRHKRNDR
jgi:hypothetical protein